jgi:hypothetical protein
MNKQVLNTLLVCVAIPLVFGVLGSIGGNVKDLPIILGLAFVIAGALYLLPGIILALIKDKRFVGMGMLLSSAVLWLIGFSLCSTQSINFQ